MDLADDSEPSLQERASAIVGGDDVPEGKWPDTVAVLGDGACTGTLIAPDVVLTAGHCADIQPTVIVADTTDYTSGGTSAGVARTVAYPGWESTYDVAVVVLDQPITSVTPRAVGTDCTFKQFTSNTMVQLVGFGATDMQGQAANTLLKEALTQVTDPMCASGNGCNSSVAPGGEFIAGGTGSADSCFGDSGGPVYLPTPRGPVVVGAVSRGVDNAATPCGAGGIYVRTDKIVQWIEETAGKVVAKDDCAAGPDDGDGTGTGTGGGSGTGEPGENYDYGDITGGCSTGAGGSGVGVLALVGLALAGRRRRACAKPAEAKPAEDPATWPRR